MGDFVIDLKSICKDFGGKTVLQGLVLSVPRGSIFGFLGRNGAGKTTAIRMMMGHLPPSGGEVRVLGESPWEHDTPTRRRIGYVSENMNLPAWMTPTKAAAFCRSFYPNWDAALESDLLRRFELQDAGKFKNMSKGQKRKTCIMLALCQRPEVLIMDEPASGLDSVVRREFLEVVLDIACEGDTAVFFSSHLITDMERIVDRIAVLSRGKILLQGDLDDLKQRFKKLAFPKGTSRSKVENHFAVHKFYENAGYPVAVIADYSEEKMQAFRTTGNGDETRVENLNLEDIFVESEKAEEGAKA